MKTSYIPVFLLVLLYCVFAGSIILAIVQLPDRVATHFNIVGQPDGWMSRTTHVVFMSAFGLLFPLMMLGVFSVVKCLPASMVNIPHRDYWLAPERRSETCRYLIQHGLWFACLLEAFVIGIHLLVIEANRAVPPQLSSSGFLTMSGCFLVGTALWVAMMIRHFLAKPAPTA